VRELHFVDSLMSLDGCIFKISVYTDARQNVLPAQLATDTCTRYMYIYLYV